MRYHLFLSFLLLLATIGCASAENTSFFDNISAPENYSDGVLILLNDTDNNSYLSEWEILENSVNVWTTFTNPSFFWFVVMLLPFIAMYNRQKGVMIVAVIYLFTGGFLATRMPTMFGTIAYYNSAPLQLLQVLEWDFWLHGRVGWKKHFEVTR